MKYYYVVYEMFDDVIQDISTYDTVVSEHPLLWWKKQGSIILKITFWAEIDVDVYNAFMGKEES